MCFVIFLLVLVFSFIVYFAFSDDATQDDLFRDGSDEEVAEDDADQEKWRLQRFEREKFLQEMKVK